MKIKKLPAEARSKLQSGLIITDAVQCVLELVHNSLDAEATGVAIRVDLKNYQIRVIDNGKGIGKEDFELVGEKFMTSKYHSFHCIDSTFPLYGFKGLALSSLMDVCKSLTIETKSEDDGPTFIKVFQNNKTSAVTEVNSERRGTGTTVTVEDFMCTMPVRRKRISEVFDIEEMKNQLQYLAIIHFNVCFTLRNDNKGIILLQTPQASSTLESISNVFGKTVAKSLKALCYKEKKYEVTGFISLKPQIQNNVQLLYINKRIITKGVTHKFINNVIKEYVGKYNLSADSSTAQISKGLKSYCHNIFILEIRCPHSHYELFTNMRKTTVEFRNWKNVLQCLHKAVKGAFKEVLNLDSSSNVQENDENNENEISERKKKFGTSVLMNAVKGAAVKRGLGNKKDQRRKRKKRLEEIPDKFGNKKPISESVSDFNSKEISHDSLESPIPKKHLKCVKPNCEIRNTTAFNQSFVEFHEWLKEKLKTDINALNFYNDFLEFRNGGKPHSTHTTEVSEFKSPVVGGKLKRKKMESPKKLKKKQQSSQSKLYCGSVIDEEMAVVARHQLKIFPSTRLRMKKAVQFTAEMNEDFPINFNFDTTEAERASTFREPCNFSTLNELPRQVEFNHTLPSLPSSEIQLTNIIRFRNWSEQFRQQQVDILEDVPQITQISENTFCPAPGTWASHYQEVGRKTVELNGEERRVTVVPLHGKNITQNDENLDDFSFQSIPGNGSLNECTNKRSRNAFNDVEIQVNISKTPLQKLNAVVQTSLMDSLIPESPYFKNSNAAKRKIRIARTEDAEVEPTEDSRASNLSQEVPNPDFWNNSPEDCNENNLEQFCNTNELNKKRPVSALMNEKNSTPSEFLCGQKSSSLTKPQNEESASKETQTLAAIWADSLTEIVNKQTDSNSRSESTLPKTIPVDDIECNIVQPIESRFCLTERHDFIPKGLSPSFSSTETSRTFTLSPREKCRLKLTVESAQSDILAVVKWQDESTGDSVKPVIPDGILDEMRQNAGKNVENPVLSASLSYCAMKVHNLLHSFAFTKELLSDIEIIGQLDKKFIVTKMKLSVPKKMELISLFDQHAVDERIKLEELIKGYSSADGKFATSRLNPPVECVLHEFDVRVLTDLSEKFLNIGLVVKAVNENTVTVKEIPTFVLDKHEKDLKNKKKVSLSDALQTLIISIVNEMRETRGALSKIPKVIHDAFCLEACHKAIKFNRALSVEDMTEMINKLKGCNLPFQCAHGRPSVIPIIDLEDFHSMMKESESIELKKLKKFRRTENLETNSENLDIV